MHRTLILLLATTSMAVAQEFDRAETPVDRFDNVVPDRSVFGEQFEPPPQNSSRDSGRTFREASTISVVDPNNEPASFISAIPYSNAPLVIGPLYESEGMPHIKALRPTSRRGQQHLVEAIVPTRFQNDKAVLTPGQRFLLTTGHGYTILPAGLKNTADPVMVKPWCRSAGTVTINGQPIESGYVQAVWESFPFHEKLTNHHELDKAPALILSLIHI